MNEHYTELMIQFPLLKGHTRHGAQYLIEQGEIREYEPGDALCREGDEATFVLLLLTGKVQVFVQRQGRDLVLLEASPGTLLGELAVLCGLPRSASLRVMEKSAALYWKKESFRRILLGNAFLSEQILRQSLRTLIEKEQALINSLAETGDSQI